MTTRKLLIVTSKYGDVLAPALVRCDLRAIDDASPSTTRRYNMSESGPTERRKSSIPDANNSAHESVPEDRSATFTDMDRQFLISEARNLEALSGQRYDVAWEHFACFQPKASAAEWRGFWEKDVRPSMRKGSET